MRQGEGRKYSPWKVEHHRSRRSLPSNIRKPKLISQVPRPRVKSEYDENAQTPAKQECHGRNSPAVLPYKHKLSTLREILLSSSGMGETRICAHTRTLKNDE